MRLSFSLPTSLLLSPLLLIAAVFPQLVAAQTVQTSEYIYIGFEAEDHVTKNGRWVLTTPTTPTEENDPDGNHSDLASGSTYLELLPDIRVTHDDVFGPPQAFWSQGGEGPDADYAVNFPEPGRYFVHVRAYSTGTEDNGLHIGINGTWPQSGQRMQFCTAHLTAWWWSSAQRDAGGNGSCGIEKSIWLDVPSAGTHTVSISAREDGFEIDRLVLIKDLSDNTRICEPTNVDDVNCRNGSIESADGFVDLAVRLESVAVGADSEIEPPNPVEIEQGDEITLTAKIENLDAFDTATDIVLTLSPVTGEWTMIEMDERCVIVADEFKCTLDDLHPTAPDENAPFVFTMQSAVEGDLRIDASVFSAELDDSPANDVAATIVRVGEGEPVVEDTDVVLELAVGKSEFETGETLQLMVVISNDGVVAVDNLSFIMDVPQGLAVSTTSLPIECTVTNKLQCHYDALEVAASQLVKIQLFSEVAGVYTISGSVTAGNDNNPNNNFDSTSVLVEDQENGTTTIGGVDSAQTTGDTTAGSTDAASTTDSGDDSSTGSLTVWFALLLVLLHSTRLYGRHQRQVVAIGQ